MSASRLGQLSDFLVDALPRAPRRTEIITSRVGWLRKDKSLRWTWVNESTEGKAGVAVEVSGYADRDASGQPLEQEPILLGETFGRAGDFMAWRSGLKHLVSLGEAGNTALVCVALSIGSPYVRILGKRNPIMGLVARSSRGKGTAINYALSVWGDPSRLTIPASSTAKGVQDLAMGLADLPVFADEIHMLDDVGKSRLLYYLGNGQRRVTSSRTQRAVGGERRWGVAFYAAEGEILDERQGGVIMRSIQLDGDPCPDAETANILAQATRNYGTEAEWISSDLSQAGASDIEAWAAELRGYQIPGLGGDDASTLAIIRMGALTIGRMLRNEIPGNDAAKFAERLTAWLVARLSKVRTERVDSTEAAWQAMFDIILHADVHPDGRLELSRETVAWRTPWHFDINTRHPRLSGLLDERGGESVLLRAWAERGWILRGDGSNIKIKRRGAGRVLRVSVETLAAQGFHDDYGGERAELPTE